VTPILVGIALVVILIDLLDLYRTALGTALYKIGMTIVGFLLAELIWSIGFRPYFGKFEGTFFYNLGGYQVLSIGIFRGLLYASIIIACALGL